MIEPHPDCRAPHKSIYEYDGPTHQGDAPDATVPRPQEDLNPPALGGRAAVAIPERELHPDW